MALIPDIDWIIEQKRNILLGTLVFQLVIGITFSISTFSIGGACYVQPCYWAVTPGMTFQATFTGFLYILQPIYALYFLKNRCTQIVGGGFLGRRRCWWRSRWSPPCSGAPSRPWHGPFWARRRQTNRGPSPPPRLGKSPRRCFRWTSAWRARWGGWRRWRAGRRRPRSWGWRCWPSGASTSARTTTPWQPRARRFAPQTPSFTPTRGSV
ncbi:unnamed protein product [Heterosigma akashiwo]